jgi:hypothetical protein
MIKKYAGMIVVSLWGTRAAFLIMTYHGYNNSMFQGLAVEYLNAHEADGSPIETTQDGVVVAHLVPLPS